MAGSSHSVQTPASSGRGLTILAVASTIAAGVLVAAQHRVNGELGQRLDDGFTAALISFSIGWGILLAIIAFSPVGRRGFATLREGVRAQRIAPWMLLGGLGGAFLVLSQGVVAGILGVAIFTIATVTGQTVTALIVDARGLGGARRSPVTPPRLIGALITLVAVVVAVAPQLGTTIPIAAVILPLIAGVGIGLQQAVNGRVRAVSHSALTATTLNFTVGTSALAAATAVSVAVNGLPEALPTEPWLYLGGALGAVFIAIQTATVARIGVLVLGLSLVAGQLLGSLVFDLVLPIGVPSSAATAIGAALTLVGVAVAAIGRARAR